MLLGAGAASTGFGDLRAAAPALPAFTRNAVFLLALLGFGSKAGLVPLHVWLPLAHPAAPSHVSALMSGAMIKLGIYGLLRIGLDLLGGGPAWWGGASGRLGAVSALLGVLYALMEQDLKRLLAYSTVENVGIIFLGVGAGFLFHSYGLPALALLATGRPASTTPSTTPASRACSSSARGRCCTPRTRGTWSGWAGSSSGMPRTALCFLIGAVAISGLPPLNGFVSEWLVFQALLGGAGAAARGAGVLMPLAVGMLALTSGLAAACFVKAFGISFLAIPRSAAAAQAREAPWPMQIGDGRAGAGLRGPRRRAVRRRPGARARSLGGPGGLLARPSPSTLPA